MNKRIFILLAILILALVVVGCSSGNTDNNYEAEEKQEIGKKENFNVKEEIKVEQKADLNKENKKSTQKLLNPRDLERYNGEGDIQMGIIFANPLSQEKEGYLTFVVQMDNHSYNLDEYDLSKYSILLDDKGNSPQGDAKWEVYSGGGHHVINYLLFPDDGFITSDTKYVKLVIKDFIDLPVREFIWEKEFLGI
ncbi:MAG: hypothetical protein JM58_13675 [Peptococcaceae bacterium BICA1-8]|nr:MAG: hypothetical protein JM58_13675 [Peptococcaceae bacterium BICA1-8]